RAVTSDGSVIESPENCAHFLYFWRPCIVPVEVAGNAGHIAFPVKAPDGGLPSWPHSFVGDERRHSRSRLIHYSVPRSACRPGWERLASARTTSAPQLRTGGGIPRTRTHRSLGLPIRDGL